MCGLYNKNEEVFILGFPSRIGIRKESINKSLRPRYQKRILEIKEKEYNEGKNKINLSISELNETFENSISTNTKLKLILWPFYNPNELNLRTEKMTEEDVRRLIMENSVSGVYQPLRYVDSFYTTNKYKFDFKIIKNIEVFKVFQNEKNVDDLVKWIKEKINED